MCPYPIVMKILNDTGNRIHNFSRLRLSEIAPLKHPVEKFTAAQKFEYKVNMPFILVKRFERDNMRMSTVAQQYLYLLGGVALFPVDYLSRQKIDEKWKIDKRIENTEKDVISQWLTLMAYSAFVALWTAR